METRCHYARGEYNEDLERCNLLEPRARKTFHGQSSTGNFTAGMCGIRFVSLSLDCWQFLINSGLTVSKKGEVMKYFQDNEFLEYRTTFPLEIF